MSRELRAKMKLRQFEAGQELVRQGERVEQIYLLMGGQVRVLLSGSGRTTLVARLGKGDWIGETALFSGNVSSTTVVAETEVSALCVAQGDFLAAARRHPAVFEHIARELARRLRSSDDLLGRGRQCRLVVFHYEPQYERQARGVVAACRDWAPHALITLTEQPGGQAMSVGDYLEEPARIAGLHERVRRRHRITVGHGQASPEQSASFLRAVREFAPLVVLASPRLVDPAIAEMMRHAVILGSIAERDFDVSGQTTRSVRFDPGADPHAVARAICGQRIGLALGGGGARGFAHLGVLRALRKGGLPIDAIAGTSVGAAVGAGVAAGMSLQEIGASMEATGRWSALPHPIPGHSLFSGAAMQAELRRQHGNRTFEELAMALATVAVDVKSGEEVVFSSGPLVPAVMASMALPGIFPAVRHEGRLLVDGGLRSPVPVAACRSLGADIVVASRLRVAHSRLVEGGGDVPELPWMSDIILRSIDVMQEQLATQGVDADVIIDTMIPHSQADLLDFRHRAAFEALGEAAATATLAALPDGMGGGLRPAA